jgi:hypothetical protein
VVAQGVTRIYPDPDTLILSPGDTGTLEIRVENVSQLAGAEMHLTFAPTVLEIVDTDAAMEGVQIAHGDFLSPDFVVQNTVDSSSGTIDYAIACIPVDKAVSGDGVLARIPFNAIAHGETEVRIRSTLLADKQSRPIEVETGSSMVFVNRSGPSPMVMALIWGVAIAVAACFVALVWRVVLAR